MDETIRVDTETTAADYAKQMKKHLLGVGFKPGDGTLDMSTIRAHGFPIGKINRIYGHNPKFDFNHVTQGLNYLSQGVQAATIPFRNFTVVKKDHRITLKDLQTTTPQERFDKLIDKLVKFTNLVIDEEFLQNHACPKKAEIVRLTRLFIKSQPRTFDGQHRFGELSVFDTEMGMTVRLFLPQHQDRPVRHTLVYATVRSYRLRDELNLAEAPLVEGTWNEAYAHMALQLLRQATVLDALAEI